MQLHTSIEQEYNDEHGEELGLLIHCQHERITILLKSLDAIAHRTG